MQVVIGVHTRLGNQRAVKCAKAKRVQRLYSVARSSIKRTQKRSHTLQTRTFTVFNVEQVDIDGYEYGTDDKSEYVDMTSCSLMAFFQADNAPSLAVGSPAYAPYSDKIFLPNTWINEDLAAGTIAHEIIHSTGHKSRLSREGVVKASKFGSHGYSFEELIAELGSLFLCAELGLLTDEKQDNGAAYIESWLKVLKDNPSWVYKAAQQASKATEHALAMVRQGEERKGAQVA